MTLGRLVDGLRSRGIRVTVVAPRRRDREEAQGGHTLVQVRGLPIPRYPELRFGLPCAHRLRRLWNLDPPDIVHVATEGPLGWSALRAARARGLPVVSSFHTNFHSYGSHYGYGFLRKPVLKWLRHCHNRTRLTFAPSGDLIRTLERDGFANLRLFARGVDLALFGPHRRDEALRGSWGAQADTPVALHVGRLAGEKNLELVVRAWQRMRDRLQDLKLVLVGDGPERRRIEKAFPEVIFAGMQRGEALAAHYASADCFLFASVTETFGNVVTEAMASGLPVLAYDYAAPGRFIKSGTNGMLADYNDSRAFIDQAMVLAGNRQEWTSIGSAARETMRPHSWDAIIDQYLKELHSLPEIQTLRST